MAAPREQRLKWHPVKAKEGEQSSDALIRGRLPGPEAAAPAVAPLKPEVGESKEGGKIKEEEQKYGTAEHMYAVNRAYEKFLQQNNIGEKEAIMALKQNGLRITLTNDGKEGKNGKVIVSAGAVAALGADFYGEPKSPISFGKGSEGKRQNFLKAYQALVGTVAKTSICVNLQILLSYCERS